MATKKKIEEFMTALDNYVDEKIAVHDSSNDPGDSYGGVFDYHIEERFQEAIYALFDTEKDKR